MTASLLQGVRRVLFAHAHPDDETLATGALIAHLTGRGIACDLVTASRGELGEVVPGSFTPDTTTPGQCQTLDDHRRDELRRALAALGVERHCFLGTAPARAAGQQPRSYRDSGMAWIRPGLAGPADASDLDSFTAADPDEEVADLVGLLQAWPCDLVVSYDAGGGYGHPDHVRMHQVARAAARRAGVGFAEVRHHPGEGVEWFDLPETLPVVATALRQHASQLTVQPRGSEVVHVGGQREAIVTAVGLAMTAP